MIEQDGDETIYATGGVVRTDPMRRMLEVISPGTAARADGMAAALNDYVRSLRLVDEIRYRPLAPKTYSPIRRWLRAERAREHQEALALGHYSEMPVRRYDDGEIEHVVRFVGFGRFG